MKLLSIIAVVVLASVFIWYWFFHTSPGTTMHTLTYSGTKLYEGNNPVIVSSDGDENIVYATPDGVMQYNITDETTTTISTIIATGLAFNGTDFWILDKNGVVINATTKENEYLGVSDIHDTVGGFSITSDGITSATGSTEAVNGNYGSIQLKIT